MAQSESITCAGLRPASIVKSTLFEETNWSRGSLNHPKNLFCVTASLALKSFLIVEEFSDLRGIYFRASVRIWRDVDLPQRHQISLETVIFTKKKSSRSSNFSADSRSLHD